MSVYLQRLLARVAPGGGTALAPGSVPAAPLSSPLADHDQRLGLPDFEAPVPSVFEEPQVVEPVRLPREKPNSPVADKISSERPAKIGMRPAPELRLVGDPPPEASSAKGTPEPAHASEAVEISVQAPVLAPSPLDIGAADLERVAPPQVDEIQPGDGDSTDALPQAPETAARRATPWSEPVEAIENEPATLSKDSVQQAMPLPEASPQNEPAPRRVTKIVSPDVTDDVSEVPAIALAAELPEPATSDRDVRVSSLEDARAADQRSPAAINIEQIIIDVHEPQPAPRSNASGRPGPPATAAAASIIGPLPVRRSTISLFGMRRR